MRPWGTPPRRSLLRQGRRGVRTDFGPTPDRRGALRPCSGSARARLPHWGDRSRRGALRSAAADSGSARARLPPCRISDLPSPATDPLPLPHLFPLPFRVLRVFRGQSLSLRLRASAGDSPIRVIRGQSLTLPLPVLRGHYPPPSSAAIVMSVESSATINFTPDLELAVSIWASFACTSFETSTALASPCFFNKRPIPFTPL